MASSADRDGKHLVTDGRIMRRAPSDGREHAGRSAPWSDEGNQVFKFSPDGKLLMTLGTPGGAAAPGFFYQPNDILVAAADASFVPEELRRRQLAHPKFGDGKSIKRARKRSGDGCTDIRMRSKMDSRGRLFVGDSYNN